MTLSRQLIALLLLLLLVVFTGTFLISAQNTRVFLQEQMASHAQDTATSLALSISPYLIKDDMVMVTSMVDAIFDRGFYREIRVERLDGTPLLKRELPVVIDGVPDWFIRLVDLRTPTEEALITSGWTQEGRVLVLSHPGYAYAQLWESLVGISRWFLISGLVVSLLGAILLRWVLRPLRDIERQANAISEREFPVLKRLPYTRDLRSIVLAMNRMSRKVGQMLMESEQLAAGLRREAYQHPVTGLSNKRHFMDTLASLIDSPEEFSHGALCLIQLNEFKRYNDSKGYMAGDELLQDAARLLQQLAETIPRSLLSHLNGADFALVVEACSEDEAAQLGSRISAALATLYPAGRCDSADVSHTGVAYYTGDQSLSELLSEADMALQQARQKEANGWCLADTASRRSHPVRSASQWRAFIEQALAMDRIQLQRQPVVSAPGRELLHYEVLVRIADPSSGDETSLVNAGIFMPQAERAGMTAEIDRAVVARVLADLTSDHGQRCAVNISPQSLQTPGFLEWLEQQLQAHPAAAERIIFEMPEYGALGMLDQVRNLIQVLERYGCEFSLDHFGRSLRSFAYLRSFKTHYLKIDGSYMRSLGEGGDNYFFLQALAKIAHGLDIKVIGESIETEAQWELLPSLHIDGAQGYFVGRPE